eukprot:355066-Chlamydomonas_euryale.AAC.4
MGDEGWASKGEEEERNPDMKCFVGGLSWQMKDEDLKEGGCRWRMLRRPAVLILVDRAILARSLATACTADSTYHSRIVAHSIQQV